eukprot:scaffold36161_cov63-Phaeocystis_antarctica.AAC.2
MHRVAGWMHGVAVHTHEAEGCKGLQAAARGCIVRRISRLSRACARAAAAATLSPRPSRWSLRRRTRRLRGRAAPPMSKTRLLSLQPAGAPEASFDARACSRLPQASASLVLSAGRAALAGHIRPCVRHSVPPTSRPPRAGGRPWPCAGWGWRRARAGVGIRVGVRVRFGVGVGVGEGMARHGQRAVRLRVVAEGRDEAHCGLARQALAV